MLLVMMTVLPVVVILAYMYFYDRYQREPLHLLGSALLLGCLTPMLVIVLMAGLERAVDGQFWEYGPFFNALITAAVPEESIKFAALMLIAWRSRYFDEYFDGIVYAVCVSMGFAVVESGPLVRSSYHARAAIGSAERGGEAAVPP